MIRGFRSVLILCLSMTAYSSLVSAQAIYSSTPVLTVDEAIRLALKHNLQIENADLQVDRAEGALAAIKTARLPRLDLRGGVKEHLSDQSYTFNQGVYGNYPVVGDIPGKDIEIDSHSGTTSFLSANVVQPLSQLYRINLAVEKGEITQEMAEQQLRAVQNTTVKQVKSQYYAILRTQSDLVTSRDSIEFYLELDNLVANYVEQKVALSYESLDVQARLARQQHDVMMQQNLMRTQKEKLNNLLGRELEDAFDVAVLPAAINLVLESNEAIKIAREQRPELREAKLAIEKAQLGYQIKKSEYIPEVNLVLRYSQLYNVELVPEDEAYVGVHAKWEIYDWGRKRKELANETAEITRAKNKLRQLEGRTDIEIHKGYRSLAEAQDLLRVARISQTAAREKLRVIMNLYRLQDTLLKDVLEARTELDSANAEYNRAILGIWNAQAELDKLLGVG